MRRSLDSIWLLTVRAHASACSLSVRSSDSVAGRSSSTSRSRLIRAKSSGGWAIGRPRDPKGSSSLALERPERTDESVRGDLPALAVDPEGRLVGVSRPSHTLESAPGGSLPLQSLLDLVFTLFAQWVHLVEVDPSQG